MRRLVSIILSRVPSYEFYGVVMERKAISALGASLGLLVGDLRWTVTSEGAKRGQEGSGVTKLSGSATNAEERSKRDSGRNRRTQERKFLNETRAALETRGRRGTLMN
jgi:hypothetical protein